jgi:hypothetical protein
MAYTLYARADYRPASIMCSDLPLGNGQTRLSLPGQLGEGYKYYVYVILGRHLSTTT